MTTKLFILWFLFGAIGALAYVQDIQRICSVPPQGHRVLAMGVMGPVGWVLLYFLDTPACKVVAPVVADKENP